MDLNRKNKMEDKLYNLMEATVDTLTRKVQDPECSAADLNAAVAALKLNSVNLERMGNKGPDPDMPSDEDLDLPFQETVGEGVPLH